MKWWEWAAIVALTAIVAMALSWASTAYDGGYLGGVHPVVEQPLEQQP